MRLFCRLRGACRLKTGSVLERHNPTLLFEISLFFANPLLQTKMWLNDEPAHCSPPIAEAEYQIVEPTRKSMRLGWSRSAMMVAAYYGESMKRIRAGTSISALKDASH